MNLEDFIKDLAPELQEKARACGSVEELIALAKDAKIPVPDEALEAIAGGQDAEDVGCGKPDTCPSCGSTNVTYTTDSSELIIYYHYTCHNCGYQWTEESHI